MKLIRNILLLISSAAVGLLTGCADGAYLGADPGVGGTEQGENAAISFVSNASAYTRSTTGAQAAALLGGSFYVYGDRMDAQHQVAPVFDNYQVSYTAGYGNSSGMHSDWKYMGLVSKRGIMQNVKYWDESALQYRFVAFAGLPQSQLIAGTSQSMRLQIADAPSAGSVYVADRVTATPTKQTATATTPATIAYGDIVQLQFRRLVSQMRIGFYETIPGYAVKDLIFYYVGAPTGSYTVGVGGAFPQSGSYTLAFDDATNVAHTTFVGASNTLAFSQTFGQLQYTAARHQGNDASQPYIDADGALSATPVNTFLGTTSTTATYGVGTYTIDGTPGVASSYRPILPSEDNTLCLQMRVDYTLVSLDGKGEQIHVRDACVRVPIEYIKWKPNHSYTYLFKISDNSNGYTGVGGGGTITTGPGRDPDPNHGGGDNDPVVDPVTGQVIPPYVPDPTWPLVPNPDYDPSQPEDPTTNPSTIVDPLAPLIPNPAYPAGPDGDQHDPSNPVPDPGSVNNPATLFPITFDAVVVESEDALIHEEEIKKN